MMEFDSVSICKQMIAALEEGHYEILDIFDPEINRDINAPSPKKNALQNRFRLIILLGVATGLFLCAAGAFQVFNRKYDNEIKYALLGGYAFLLLLGALGYWTNRQSNNKFIELDKRQCTTIKTHGFQAQQLARYIKTESTLNPSFNQLTVAVLNDSANILCGYSNKEDALRSLNRIETATKHAQFLITNPTIKTSNQDCGTLTNAIAASFRIIQEADEELRRKRAARTIMHLVYGSFFSLVPAGLLIASSFEETEDRQLFLYAFYALSVLLATSFKYVNNGISYLTEPSVREKLQNSNSKVLKTLSDNFKKDDGDNIDYQLMSIVTAEIKCASANKAGSLTAEIDKCKQVKAALEQAVIFAKAKFTQFKLPEGSLAQRAERQPLLKSAQPV